MITYSSYINKIYAIKYTHNIKTISSGLALLNMFRVRVCISYQSNMDISLNCEDKLTNDSKLSPCLL